MVDDAKDQNELNSAKQRGNAEDKVNLTIRQEIAALQKEEKERKKKPLKKRRKDGKK